MDFPVISGARGRAFSLLLGIITAGCTHADSDIAPDIAARAVRERLAPVAVIDAPISGLSLVVGDDAVLALTAYDSAAAALPGRTFAITSSDSRVATVAANGRLTGHAAGRVELRLSAGGLTAVVPVAVHGPPTDATVDIDVFPERALQQMDGWEATQQSGELNCGAGNFARYSTELFDRAVGELGLNRIRLEVRSGMEAHDLVNPGGNEAQPTGVPFRMPWFNAANDNDDPRVADSTGFQFDWFDFNVARTVIPLRDRLAARGERLSLTLTYVDFFASTPFEQMRDPEEYAELLAYTFQHMQRRFGFVPDAVEVLLEPDNTPWTPEQVGRALVAAGDRLRDAGFHPEFIAPSTTSLAAAVRFYDGIRRVPRTLDYLHVLSYHRYSGISSAALQALVVRARRDGLRLAMLEHADATAAELHEDLTRGMVSAWERFALAYCGRRENPDASGVYYQISLRNPIAPKLVETTQTQLLRHYFAWVRLGAHRIAASSTSDSLSPVAFRNVDGSMAVVLRAAAAGRYRVAGLPAGRYDVVTTIDGKRLTQHLGELRAGDALSGLFTAPGLATIHSR